MEKTLEKLSISFAEGSKVTGLSVEYLYDLAKSPDFYPAFRVGKRILLNVELLKKWIDEQSKKRNRKQ